MSYDAWSAPVGACFILEDGQYLAPLLSPMISLFAINNPVVPAIPVIVTVFVVAVALYANTTALAVIIVESTASAY